MGCDIHMHVEVKKDGQWHHYAAPSCDRSYQLFTKLAGVRDDDDGIEPIAQPRGIPADASLITRAECEDYGSDGHSHSWIDQAEIAGVEAWARKQGWTDPRWKGQDIPWAWDGYFHCYLNGNGFGHGPEIFEDIRFVFWFDN